MPEVAIDNTFASAVFTIWALLMPTVAHVSLQSANYPVELFFELIIVTFPPVELRC